MVFRYACQLHFLVMVLRQLLVMFPCSFQGTARIIPGSCCGTQEKSWPYDYKVFCLFDISSLIYLLSSGFFCSFVFLSSFPMSILVSMIHDPAF